jgi:hypothetical protein
MLTMRSVRRYRSLACGSLGFCAVRTSWRRTIDYYVTVDTGKHVGMLERPRALWRAVNLFPNNWEQRQLDRDIPARALI